jgi:hypothetical protein
VGLVNLGSESETCVGSRVHLVGVSISFEKNFYRLPFTPPSLVRRIGPSVFAKVVKHFACELLIYIKDSPYRIIRKVCHIKMAELRSGEVVKNTILFL